MIDRKRRLEAHRHHQHGIFVEEQLPFAQDRRAPREATDIFGIVEITGIGAGGCPGAFHRVVAELFDPARRRGPFVRRGGALLGHKE